MDNTSNVVERLRAFKPYSLNDGEPFGPKVCTEAADTIERLRAMLAIAVDEHDTSDGRSNDPAHWTNEARAMIAAAEGGE